MSFSTFISNSEWTSESSNAYVKPSSWNRKVHGKALQPTRSNTPEGNSPSSFSSDAFSDRDLTIDSFSSSSRTVSSPTTFNAGDASDPRTFEIDVCPKRKKFNTVEERRLFVEEYKRKHKTELCKNWELKKVCKFGDKCCFAHGKHELKNKTLTHVKYKTKPCKQYHQTGYCPYGQRCQYLHKEAIQPNIFFTPCQRNSGEESYTYEALHEINKLCGTDSDLETIMSKLPSRPRLGVFGRLAVCEA